MKVKELIEQLAVLDQEAEVAVLSATDEYWGNIYSRARYVSTGQYQIDGPKKGESNAVLITD